MNATRLDQVRTIALTRAVRPELSSEHEAAVDAHWHEHRISNPSAFDGAMVSVLDVDDDHGGLVTIVYAHTTYRHYLARHAADDLPYARALYVAVLVRTTDGRFVVGRMHGSTSNPGRLQLPGGNVEPPVTPTTDRLVESDLAGAASRELLEETGLFVPASSMRLWAVKRGGRYGDVGVIYTPTQLLPARNLSETFTTHVAAGRTVGVDPELTELHFVASTEDLDALPGNQVDYLSGVVHLHQQQPPL